MTIKVYLTKAEKTKFKREAKVRGLTMSSLAAHKFLTKTQQPIVVGTPPEGRSEVFKFSTKDALKNQIEYGAFMNEVPVSHYVREIIVD